MTELTNSKLLRKVFNALYQTACRRTSDTYAIAIIGAITKTLVQRYEFLVFIRINPEKEKIEDVIQIPDELDTIDPKKIAKAIEAIVRVIYMDLRSKAGLFFINEINKNAGHQVISRLRELGVDLDLLQIEQHYLYRRFTRSIKTTEEKDQHTMLGYSWKDVSSWKYDDKTKACVLYDNKGKILDKLYLELVIKKHVGFLEEDDLTGSSTIQSIGTDIDEKELEFLKILQKKDMDFETAIFILHISEHQLNSMVTKLLRLEMLQYVSHNEVSITEIGLNWLKNKDEETKDLIRI